ncbi:MAG: alpha/beta fold hydrolase [Candidatus Dormibacteria bacterium]
MRQRVVTQGAGPVLLLMHGGTDTLEQFEPCRDALAQRHLVVTPDSRAHGRTLNPDPSLTYPQLAADMFALLDALNLERAVVGGFSDGANVALEMAMSGGSRVAGALLHGAVVRSSAAYQALMDEFFCPRTPGGPPDLGLMENAHPDAIAAIRETHAGGPDGWRGLVTGLHSLWTAPPAYSAPDLGRARCPILVMTGDRDQYSPLEDQLALMRSLPDAELLVWPGVAHEFPPDLNGYIAACSEFIERRCGFERGPL